MEWMKILYVIGALFLLWIVYRSIRNNPQAFSRENLNKSFYTMAILALFLILVIGVLVMLLRL